MIFFATKSGRKLILQRIVPYSLLTGFMDAQEAIFSHQGLLEQPFTISTPTVLANSEKVLSEANHRRPKWVSLCWVVGCHPYLLTSSTIKSQKHFTLRDARLPLEPSEQTTKRQKQREKNIPNSSFPDCLLTELAAKPQPEMETQGSSFTKKKL